MFEPIEVDNANTIFSAKIDHLIPPMKDIPDEFKCGSYSKWNALFSTWFFDGLPEGVKFIPNEGVDSNKALRHLSCLMRTFSTQQEDKEKICSYVMSIWFKDIVDKKGNSLL